MTRSAKTQPKGPPGRGGRPKKHDAERRIASTRADLTLIEKQQLRDRVKRAGMTEAEFVRRAALDAKIVVRQGQSDYRLVHEINQLVLQIRAIGINANQIALNKNTDRQEWLAWEDVTAEVNARLAQAEAVLDRVVEALDD